MTPQHPADDGIVSIIKVAIGWLAYFFGSITLNDVSLFCVIVYTLLQTVSHLRKEYGFFKRKD